MAENAEKNSVFCTPHSNIAVDSLRISDFSGVFPSQGASDP
jgi:hypothetical protein